MIADMAMELEATRQLVYSTAMLKDASSPDTSLRCSMAKCYATEACNRIAAKAVQIHGGRGYMKDYRVERLYRDARITTIYEGTTQIQQMIIGNTLLK